MDQRILDAIKAKANNQIKNTTPQKIVSAVTQKNGVTPVTHNRKITVKIDHVINKNRLDIFFSARPEQDTIHILKSNGWYYRGKDLAWQHQYKQENIRFIQEKIIPFFECDSYPVMEVTEKNEPQIDTPLNDLDEPLPSVCTNDHLVKFETYCRQVDYLKLQLKIDLQELLYQAIDHYYNITLDN